MKISRAYILICLICGLSASCGKAHREVDRITVNYIYSKTETFRRITCSQFGGVAGRAGFMSKELRTERQIDRFMNGVEEGRSSPATDSINVRAKAFIYYKNGKESVACVDRFGNVEVDGKLVGSSGALLSFLHAECDGF